MIIICTHQSPLTLEKCLKSIRLFSEEKHKILVVETSESKESEDIAKKYNCLFTNSKLKYEIGAFNYAITNYPSEPEYFMFQDSIEVLKHQWEDMLRKPANSEKLVALCSYPLSQDPCYGCGKVFFENTFNKPFPTNESYGVMTNNFYVPQIGKQKLLDFGIDKIVANNKNDTYDSERLIGAIAYYSCGISSTAEILGDWHWAETHFSKDTGFTKYIYKHILRRQ
jgi:glycosyltransferase involved in cell wall biosynthesis